MGTSDAYDCNRRSRRRDANRRRRVEVAVERLRLPPEAGQALSAGIYGLYRNLVAQKSVDDQDRYFRQRQSRAEHKLAERTAIASGADTDPSPYVADMREFAARMVRLERLEQSHVRNRCLGESYSETYERGIWRVAPAALVPRC